MAEQEPVNLADLWLTSGIKENLDINLAKAEVDLAYGDLGAVEEDLNRVRKNFADLFFSPSPKLTEEENKIYLGLLRSKFWDVRPDGHIGYTRMLSESGEIALMRFQQIIFGSTDK